MNEQLEIIKKEHAFSKGGFAIFLVLGLVSSLIVVSTHAPEFTPLSFLALAVLSCTLAILFGQGMVEARFMRFILTKKVRRN